MGTVHFIFFLKGRENKRRTVLHVCTTFREFQGKLNQYLGHHPEFKSET